MFFDPYSEYRATKEEIASARTYITMMANSLVYKDPVNLCYVCNKVNKSMICPKCQKGVCGECMSNCSRCGQNFCYFCLTRQYDKDQKSFFLCPDCLC